MRRESDEGQGGGGATGQAEWRGKNTREAAEQQAHAVSVDVSLNSLEHLFDSEV